VLTLDAAGALNIILLAIVALATAIPAYYQWSERRLQVDLQLFKEPPGHILDSEWKVRVLRINRTLNRAMIEMDGKSIRWDGANLPFQVYLQANSPIDFRVPNNATKKSVFTIKDGEKVIKKISYDDIPVDHQYS
jgi:hypothetical protein